MSALPLPENWADRAITIDVIGAGGTGSQLADQLASLECTMRSLGHPGFRVTLHDGDHVERSNVGRQRFTHHDVGQMKVIPLVHRINGFYDLQWEASPLHVDPARAQDHLRALHDDGLVITCVDKAAFRAELGRRCRNNRTGALWLDLGNGDAQAQCVLGHLGRPSEGVRIPNILDLFPELAHMQREDEETPSCSAEVAIRRQPWPINRLVAISAMEMLWNLMRTGRLEYHGQFLQTRPFSTTPLAVDEAHWAMLGYDAAASGKKARKRRASA